MGSIEIRLSIPLYGILDPRGVGSSLSVAQISFYSLIWDFKRIIELSSEIARETAFYSLIWD